MKQTGDTLPEGDRPKVERVAGAAAQILSTPNVDVQVLTGSLAPVGPCGIYRPRRRKTPERFPNC